MFYDELKYDDKGLICGVFQDWQSGEVLTLGWLSREAVQKMWESKRAHVFRRSRGRVMMKGESSGNVQIVHDIRADCDRDALVIKIEQIGGAACHKGYRSCFFEGVDDDGALQIEDVPVFDPREVYQSATDEHR